MCEYCENLFKRNNAFLVHLLALVVGYPSPIIMGVGSCW
jgi:hypothetical protein